MNAKQYCSIYLALSSNEIRKASSSSRVDRKVSIQFSIFAEIMQS